MRPRLAIIFILLVLTPLVLLAWLGSRAAKDEARRVEDRFREVFEGQLIDIEGRVRDVVGEVERELYALSELAVGADLEGLRDLVRSGRLVRQVFVRTADGKFVHPPAAAARTEQEAGFFDRTRSVWESGVEFGEGRASWQASEDAPIQVAKGKTGGAVSRRASVPEQQVLIPQSDLATGWYGWFWGEGLNWIYWRQPAPGADVVGIEVDRMAFLSDMVAALPDGAGIGGGRAVLADARGGLIYQWGDHEQADGETPAAERALGAPLSGWRLLYYAGTPGGVGAGARVGLVGGLVAVGIALLGMALYFYREHTREVREVAQKVNFVNQVSHELKTPLTNIRLYAELAGEKLGSEPDPGLSKCLEVVTDESGRLSRLIGNVLSFAKKGRGDAVRPAPGDVGAVLASTVELFRPALERAGVEIEVDCEVGECRVDSDALGQVLANLLSNVEKYAAAGKWVRIEARRAGDTTTVAVEDRGPGVPRAARKRVFVPFARLDDSITEGASGTGIGLSIARDLARAHGGDLCVEAAADGTGSRFVLTLETPDC